MQLVFLPSTSWLVGVSVDFNCSSRITICFQVIVERLPTVAKNDLPSPALMKGNWHKALFEYVGWFNQKTIHRCIWALNMIVWRYYLPYLHLPGLSISDGWGGLLEDNCTTDYNESFCVELACLHYLCAIVSSHPKILGRQTLGSSRWQRFTIHFFLNQRRGKKIRKKYLHSHKQRAWSFSSLVKPVSHTYTHTQQSHKSPKYRTPALLGALALGGKFGQ